MTHNGPGHLPDSALRGSALGRALRAGADAILAVVLASPCAACRGVHDAPTRGPVCAACWARVTLATPPVCDGCGAPLPSWRVISRTHALCPRCRRGHPAVDRARAVGDYDGALGDIIRAFKYDGRRSLARPLGRLMREAGRDLLEGASFTVPVPLHPARRRARGFNQALDLARHLDSPLWPALRRVKNTPSQTDLPASQRHRNVRDAFAMRGSWCRPAGGSTEGGVRLEGACLLLVDDVTTTGATLEACARVLKAAGVREVRALTAARVPFRPR